MKTTKFVILRILCLLWFGESHWKALIIKMKTFSNPASNLLPVTIDQFWILTENCLTAPKTGSNLDRSQLPVTIDHCMHRHIFTHFNDRINNISYYVTNFLMHKPLLNVILEVLNYSI